MNSNESTSCSWTRSVNRFNRFNRLYCAVLCCTVLCAENIELTSSSSSSSSSSSLMFADQAAAATQGVVFGHDGGSTVGGDRVNNLLSPYYHP